MISKFSHNRRVLLGLLLILALPALACGVLSDAEELKEELQDEVPAIIEEKLEGQADALGALEGVQEAQGDSSQSQPEDDENRAPISGALRPSGLVDSVRVTITTENLDTGDTNVSTAAFVQPDSYLLADESMDVIIIDGKTYSRSDEGEFEETLDMSFIVGGLVTNLIDPWATEAGLALVTFTVPEDGRKSLGEETIRDNTTNGFEYTIPLPATLSADPVLYRVWVGADNELVYRQEIEHPYERTISTIDFEYEGVEIEAPGP